MKRPSWTASLSSWGANIQQGILCISRDPTYLEFTLNGLLESRVVASFMDVVIRGHKHEFLASQRQFVDGTCGISKPCCDTQNIFIWVILTVLGCKMRQGP